MTSTRVRLTTARLAAAALVAVVGLAGCGSDEAPAQDATTATASSSPSSPSSPSAPSTSEPADDGVPTSYDAAVGLLDAAPGPARRVNRFQVGGGAVFCILASDFVPTSCELDQASTVPAPDVCGSDGPSEAVGRVELADGAAEPVCNSDTIREGNARDLETGQTTSIGDLPVRCLARSAGVVCVDDDARSGFFVGPGRYEVF